MAEKGKTPSLIGGSAGKCDFETAKGKRTCKRCDSPIPPGTNCVMVRQPGTMGKGKPYCVTCFEKILGQTQRELNKLTEEFRRQVN
jgi:hypothetical protein